MLCKQGYFVRFHTHQKRICSPDVVILIYERYLAGSGLTIGVYGVSNAKLSIFMHSVVRSDPDSTMAVSDWVSSDFNIEYGVTRWHLTNKVNIGQRCSDIGCEMQKKNKVAFMQNAAKYRSEHFQDFQEIRTYFMS